MLIGKRSLEHIQRRQCGTGVLQLVRSAQSGIGQRASRARLAAKIPLPLVCCKAEFPAYAPQLRTDLLRMAAYRQWHVLIRADRYLAAAHDPGLFIRDGLARVAQIIGVVDIHAGDHRAIVIEYIHRIQPAAQSDFEDRYIHLVLDETLHRGQRSEFKVRKWHFFHS